MSKAVITIEEKEILDIVRQHYSTFRNAKVCDVNLKIEHQTVGLMEDSTIHKVTVDIEINLPNMLDLIALKPPEDQ